VKEHHTFQLPHDRKKQKEQKIAWGKQGIKKMKGQNKE
jgi:hypothetical protein